ncbi:MAG: helix-turn-helix domain-containing protein [Propionibacteriaceae bacterium]|nr:helix-turn-helix domain-containing protein [Propionibacteriaceae bacterium]
MSTTVIDRVNERADETVLPPADTTLIEEIESFLDNYGRQASLIAPDGKKTDIPPEVYDVLTRVVLALANGSAVTVAPVSMRLTTSQAAEILGVSRPTLVRLLEDGAIPYEKPRRHRIVRLDDLLAFKRNQDTQRQAKLAELTRQAVADGLYEATAEMYAEALREARRGRPA